MSVFLKKIKGKSFRSFGIYLGSSVLNKAIPFLLLPVLTHYLSTEEYGIISIYQVMISFTLALVGMGMQSNIARNFFKKDKTFLGQLVFNLSIVLVIAGAFFSIGLGIYLALGGTQLSIPKGWLYVLPMLAVLSMFNAFNLSILRNQKRPLVFGAFELSKTVLDLSLTLVLIIIFLRGWEGRLYGILISSGVMGIISLWHMWRQGFIIVSIKREQIESILRISMPLIPHILGGAIITLSDRVFIEEMVGTSAVGVYTVGYQFGMMLSLIAGAVSLTWSPWLYETLAKKAWAGKLKIVKATYALWGGYLALAFLLTGVAYFLLPFMTVKEFHGGYVYVIWVALGYAFQGMYTLVFPYGVHVGKTSYLGITTFFAALVNLMANYYLIKLNGPLGAAQATLISYVLMFVAVWWYSHKLYPMPWFQFRKEVKPEK